MSRFWDHTGCILGCPQEAVGPYSFTTQLVGLGCFLMRLPKQPLGEMLSCWHPRWDLPSGAEAFASFPVVLLGFGCSVGVEGACANHLLLLPAVLHLP